MRAGIAGGVMPVRGRVARRRRAIRRSWGWALATAARSRGNAECTQAFSKVDAAVDRAQAQKRRPVEPSQPPQPPVAKTREVSRNVVCRPSRLKTEEDIDKYVADLAKRLKQRLHDALENGDDGIRLV